MNNNIFAVDNNIINLIKKDNMVSMVYCYLLSNSNAGNLSRITLKQIIEDNGYTPKNGKGDNSINNKIKNSLRLLISKNYIAWINTPFGNNRLHDNFDSFSINDELWFKINTPNEKYMMFDLSIYYKIVNMCKNNKQLKVNSTLDVFLYILKHINMKEANGKCSVGYENFKKDLLISKATISKYTQALIDEGILFKKKGNTVFTNEYYLKPLLTTVDRNKGN